MAAEPWNRVNITFPGAISSVRIHFCSTTDARVKALLAENEKVLKLTQSEILQTEVRVLYDLLYMLNNSSRGNKTFKGLKQVEQCMNRLKSMKLDEALQDLKDLCPNKCKRGVSIKVGEADVPSQPMMEWFCLKVLGAAQLMSCTLTRCSRAFVLSKQHLKLEEFAVLNLVISSMLSRLWVIARGVLISLSILYQRLLELLREIASAQPMPFLTDFSLPADMAQFLGPPYDSLLTKKPKAHGAHAKKQQRKKNPSDKVKNQGGTKKVKEDLGVAVERGVGLDNDMKPFLNVFKSFSEVKLFPHKTHSKDSKQQKFKKQVREATSFTDMEKHLEKMIPWCISQKMEKEKRLLTFLHLKCQRMKYLEAAGYNVQRRLRSFRQEVCWASSPQGSSPRTCRSSAANRTLARLRIRFHSLRSRYKSSTVRTGVRKRQKRKRRRTGLSESTLSEDDHRNRTPFKAAAETSACDSHDDIDDIFASVGL